MCEIAIDKKKSRLQSISMCLFSKGIFSHMQSRLEGRKNWLLFVIFSSLLFEQQLPSISYSFHYCDTLLLLLLKSVLLNHFFFKFRICELNFLGYSNRCFAAGAIVLKNWIGSAQRPPIYSTILKSVLHLFHGDFYLA